MLKSQDCVVLIKLIAHAERRWSQRQLAEELCISVYEINSCLKRLLAAHLVRKVPNKQVKFLPILSAAEEYLIHGVKYSFPAKLKEYTPGIETSIAASIFKDEILLGDDPIPVWPYAKGKVKGLALDPLYPTVPNAVAEHPDQAFYEILVLVDAIRQGRARERKIAIKLLKEKLKYE